MNIIPLTLGTVSLDPGAMILSGPRGEVRLPARLCAVAERLMRRPGAFASRSDLITALFPDPDREPEGADDVLRRSVVRLRALLDVLSGEAVVIVTERDVGYAIRERR